jgi:hypothetical protein
MHGIRCSGPERGKVRHLSHGFIYKSKWNKKELHQLLIQKIEVIYTNYSSIDVVGGKARRKEALGKPRLRWVDNIRMDPL